MIMHVGYSKFEYFQTSTNVELELEHELELELQICNTNPYDTKTIVVCRSGQKCLCACGDL